MSLFVWMIEIEEKERKEEKVRRNDWKNCSLFFCTIEFFIYLKFVKKKFKKILYNKILKI